MGPLELHIRARSCTTHTRTHTHPHTHTIGEHMNGQKGEVLTSPPISRPKRNRKKGKNKKQKKEAAKEAAAAAGGEAEEVVEEERVLVRLFQAGKRVRVKLSNLERVDADDDDVMVAVVGANGGPVGIHIHFSWLSFYSGQPMYRTRRDGRTFEVLV